MLRSTSGRQVLVQFVGSDRESDLVLSTGYDMRQRGCEVLSVFELRSHTIDAVRLATEPHRTARVEQHRASQIRLFLIQPQIRATGSPQHFPIEPPQIIARGVLAKIDELTGPAQLPRLMPSAVRPVDPPPRRESQMLQRRERS